MSYQLRVNRTLNTSAQSGGGGEIRTLDTFRYATFPRWWNKPLSDASVYSFISQFSASLKKLEYLEALALDLQLVYGLKTLDLSSQLASSHMDHL